MSATNIFVFLHFYSLLWSVVIPQWLLQKIDCVLTLQSRMTASSNAISDMEPNMPSQLRILKILFYIQYFRTGARRLDQKRAQKSTREGQNLTTKQESAVMKFLSIKMLKNPVCAGRESEVHLIKFIKLSDLFRSLLRLLNSRRKPAILTKSPQTTSLLKIANQFATFTLKLKFLFEKFDWFLVWSWWPVTLQPYY